MCGSLLSKVKRPGNKVVHPVDMKCKQTFLEPKMETFSEVDLDRVLLTSFSTGSTGPHGDRKRKMCSASLVTSSVLEDTQSAANVETPSLNKQSLPTEASFKATTETIFATVAPAYKKCTEETKTRRQSGSTTSRKMD